MRTNSSGPLMPGIETSETMTSKWLPSASRPRASAALPAVTTSSSRSMLVVARSTSTWSSTSSTRKRLRGLSVISNLESQASDSATRVLQAGQRHCGSLPVSPNCADQPCRASSTKPHSTAADESPQSMHTTNELLMSGKRASGAPLEFLLRLHGLDMTGLGLDPSLQLRERSADVRFRLGKSQPGIVDLGGADRHRYDRETRRIEPSVQLFPS